MRPIATHVVAWSVSVCVSVCVYVMGLNPAKTAEPIEMPLACGLEWTQVTIVRWEFRIPQEEWAILGVSKHGHGRECPRSVDNGAWILRERWTLWGKGSGTWESAQRGLVISHENYFQFGFEATMRPFIKLL